MGAGVTRYGPALVGTGVAMLVIGTFLPWLRSGTALRDSYQSIAALRGPLAGANRPVVTMLDCWLAIIPVLGVGVALYVLRLRRTAAGVICAVSAGAGLLSAAVILRGDEGGPIIAPASAGPAVTLAGAVVALAGGVLVIMSTRVGSQ